MEIHPSTIETHSIVVGVGRRYEVVPRSAFVLWARLTPKGTTKQINASIYTTPNNTEIGDENSQHLLGLGTLTDGGSDLFEEGPVYGRFGLYLEVYGDVSATDEAILTVALVSKENMVAAYPSVSRWRGAHWEDVREDAESFLSNYDIFEHTTLAGTDGGTDSGSGGSILLTQNKTSLTSDLLDTITTGARYGTS